MDENKIETLGQLTEISMSEDHQADNESISSNEDKQDGASSVNEVDSNENQSDEQSNESNESLEDDLSKRIDEAFNAITEGNEKQQDSTKSEANQQPADASAIKQPKTSESGQEKLEDDKPKTEAEEEAEILAMAGNERSRKRFEKILHERKEAREIANSFVDQIKGAGYDVNSFATVLEFGRLVSSNDINQKRQAMAMLDQVRANLAAELGEEVPGVDLLKGNPDLEKEVKDMNLDRKRAVEIANARRQKAAMEQQNHFAVERAQWHQKMQTAQTQMGQVLLSKQNEPFFNQKIQAIRTWLSTGNNMQNFVNSVPPEQWATQIENIYNQLPAQFYQTNNPPVTAQAKPRQSQPQPLRSRPMNTGHRDTSGMTTADMLLDVMKDM